MVLPDVTGPLLPIISIMFAGTLAVVYVVWKFVRDTDRGVTKLPPCMWSLPFIGSVLFLPDYRIWHKEFLKMTAKIGNVFAFYMGSQYVSFMHTAEC